MTTLRFGLLRSIELLSKAESEIATNEWTNFINQIVNDSAGPANINISGFINRGKPIMLQITTGNVIVYETMSDTIQVIANDMTEFEKSLSSVAKIWESYQEFTVIPRNEDVMNQFKEFTEEIHLVAGINHMWWIHFAFRELNIHFPK